MNPKLQKKCKKKQRGNVSQKICNPLVKAKKWLSFIYCSNISINIFKPFWLFSIKIRQGMGISFSCSFNSRSVGCIHTRYSYVPFLGAFPCSIHAEAKVSANKQGYHSACFHLIHILINRRCILSLSCLPLGKINYPLENIPWTWNYLFY